MSERARFLRFLVTGGVAALVNLAARWLLSPILAYEVAVCVAYLVGMSVAFLLARNYVFDRVGGSVRAQYARFTVVNAFAFAQVWLVSVGLARVVFPYLGFTIHADTIAHVIGVLSPVATSYAGHKAFSFRPEPTSPEGGTSFPGRRW